MHGHVNVKKERRRQSTRKINEEKNGRDEDKK